MTEQKVLADRFEANRTHLRAVAYRMLGSRSEAEDAVQEAWFRLSRADTSAVGNLGGWLTTVVARVCLDMLRSRKSRREEPFGPHVPEPVVSGDNRTAAEQEAELANSVGLALLVVLETLAPAERVAFVLHDVFDLPFDEIASIVGRSSTATRQLASRARRRVRGTPAIPDTDLARQREVVDAYLAAARGGNLDALLAVLDPDVVLRADRAGIAAGASRRSTRCAGRGPRRAQGPCPLRTTGTRQRGRGHCRGPARAPALRSCSHDHRRKDREINLIGDSEQLRHIELARTRRLIHETKARAPAGARVL